MIKFFRHLRQQLLTQSKFSKYLLYAIGEIILVVIGILIALQINNKNTERIEVSKYRKQLIQVVKHVKSDAVQLADLKKSRLRSIAETAQMMKELENRNIRDLKTFMNSFIRLTGETKFVSDMTIRFGNQFEDYHNTHIHELLEDYFKLVEHVKFREYRHNEFSENMELELWNKGLFRKIGPKLETNQINNSTYTSYKTFDLEKSGIYDNETIYALCLRSEYGFSLLIKEYEYLITSGEQLTKAINNYLNQD